MKNQLLNFLLVLLLPVIGWGQKLAVNKHPITEEVTISTSWMPFFKQGIKTRGFEMDARFIERAGAYFLQLRITDQVRTHLVSEGHSLGFFSGDTKIAALKCSKGNKGREELDFLLYPISEDQMSDLLTKNVNKVVFEWERGFSDDKLSSEYLQTLRNGISMIKDKKRMDGRDMELVGWVKMFKVSDPKTVAWQRIINTDSGVYLQIKMFGRKISPGHRLNVYHKEEKVSLFAKSVTYQSSKASGRDYSFALFPVSKNDIDFMARSNISKITVQTTTDKIVITDSFDERDGLKKSSEKAALIYFNTE